MARRERPRRPQRAAGGGKRGFMIVLNGVLVLIVAVAAYARFGGGGPKVRHYIDAISVELARLTNPPPDNKPAPAPATSAAATAKAPASSAAVPAPATVAATPAPNTPPVPESSPVLAADSAPVAATTPAPVVAATPAAVPSVPPAPPKPFDPADLAGNPRAWPKTVHLKQAVVFPAILNSQVVGSVSVPPGESVNLTNIQGDQLTLDYNGGIQTVSWKLTDLEEQVAKSGALAQPAPPAAQLPADGGYVAPPVPTTPVSAAGN